MQPLLIHSFCTSGTLHVGDEIREINGISVANQTVEQLQKMLVGHTSSEQAVFQLISLHFFEFVQHVKDVMLVMYCTKRWHQVASLFLVAIPEY